MREMARTLDEVIGSLSPEQQARVSARHPQLRQEVEGLRELRRVAGKAQSELAAALRIKQPSVSKIERQADLYLSTLRTSVEALGGRLELVVHLPDRPTLRLTTIGDLVGGQDPAPKPAPARRKPAVRGQHSPLIER